MEERMVQFISALRAGGVRVSLAESADAFTAVDLMGVQEREAFKLGLRTTLVKDATGLPVFEELFPLFFGSADTPPMTDMTEDMSPEEAEMLAQALRMFNEQLRKMMEKQIALPDAVWGTLNLAWAGFFIVMGVLNLVVAYNFSTDIWVNFKLFGGMGLMLVFIVIQSLWLSRHMREPDNHDAGGER